MTDSERLDKIESSLDKIESSLEKLVTEIDTLKEETIKTNERVEIYQKASQQVVNLAFSLILTATITIVAQVIINH